MAYLRLHCNFKVLGVVCTRLLFDRKQISCRVWMFSNQVHSCLALVVTLPELFGVVGQILLTLGIIIVLNFLAAVNAIRFFSSMSTCHDIDAGSPIARVYRHFSLVYRFERAGT